MSSSGSLEHRPARRGAVARRRGPRHSKPRRPALRVLAMLAEQRLALVAVLALGTGSIALNLLGPKLLGHATDLLLAGLVGARLPAGETSEQVVAGLREQGRDTLATVLGTVGAVPGQGVDLGALGAVLLLVLAVYAVGALLMLAQGRLAALVVQRFARALRERASDKLARLPLGYFDRNPAGEVLSTVANDVDNLQRTLQLALSQLVNSVFSVLGVLAVMLLLSPPLALLVLAGVPVSIGLATWISRRAQPRFAQQWAATGALTAHVEEMCGGHPVVTAFGRRELAERTFAERNEELCAAAARAQAISGAIGPVTRFLTDLNYVVVAVAGALRVAAGSLTVGDVQAFTQYSGMFSRPVVDVAAFSGQLQSGLASAQRVFALLDAPEQVPDPVRPARLPGVRGRVEFCRASFRYRPEEPLIEDLSLTVEPGWLVAVVGPTGAGKTTLGNLLLRFYELDRGRILLDGVDIASLSREDLRSAIGVVSQDTWLFRGTIAENIAYGRPGATREDVVAAARATCVDRFVRALPDGYDTVVDESSGLSAGEKQLITIARAFLAGPAILVLDEATSSLDTRTEALVQRATKSLRAGRTSFVIAHRLSTIRDADLIVVMDSGRIVERGTHEELLHAGGLYARLHGTPAGTTRRAQRGR